MYERAAGFRFSRPVEHRAPDWYVRIGPVCSTTLSPRSSSAAYSGCKAHREPPDALVGHPAPVSCRVRAVLVFIWRPRDRFGRRAILYHGRVDPRACYGGVARIDADDEGELITDGISHCGLGAGPPSSARPGCWPGETMEARRGTARPTRRVGRGGDDATCLTMGCGRVSPCGGILSREAYALAPLDCLQLVRSLGGSGWLAS